jgi:DNA-binding MarR family transcriptional regulator
MAQTQRSGGGIGSQTEETKKVERECLGFRVRMLNRIVTGIYDNALADAGLTTGQFTVLVAIANRGRSRPAELAGLLQMDESTLSRNVERMCSKGWLRLERDADRRSHLIQITEKGEAMIRKGLPAWREAQDAVAGQLGTETVAGLRTALRKLRVEVVKSREAPRVEKLKGRRSFD